MADAADDAPQRVKLDLNDPKDVEILRCVSSSRGARGAVLRCAREEMGSPGPNTHALHDTRVHTPVHAVMDLVAACWPALCSA
jgi:hypothetical protein